MKTEEQIRLRIKALKSEFNSSEQARPFELEKASHMIEALTWVLKDIPKHCNCSNQECLDSHNCITCAHEKTSIDDDPCRICMSSYCQYLNKSNVIISAYEDGTLHHENEKRWDDAAIDEGRIRS